MEDLADLVLDMATVIVERSGLLPAILPGSSHIAAIGRSAQDDTYDALLQVFYVYMLLVRQQVSLVTVTSNTGTNINLESGQRLGLVRESGPDQRVVAHGGERHPPHPRGARADHPADLR